MEIQELKEYIKIIYKLEKSKYEIEEIINYLRQIKYNPISKSFKYVGPKKRIFMFLYTIALGMMTGIFIGILAGVFINKLLLPICICTITCTLFCILLTLYDICDEKITNRKIYTDNIGNIEATSQNNKIIKYAIEFLTTIRDNIVNTLNNIYSSNIIHLKYRNFIAITMIYEYLDTERCSELEGDFGAYSIFEHELSIDKIISEPKNISSKSEQIKYNQCYLYNTFREIKTRVNIINSKIKNCADTLNRAEAESILTSYKTQIDKKLML